MFWGGVKEGFGRERVVGVRLKKGGRKRGVCCGGEWVGED